MQKSQQSWTVQENELKIPSLNTETKFWGAEMGTDHPCKDRLGTRETFGV